MQLISNVMTRGQAIFFISVALASALPSAFAQNAIRPEILEVIGDPETGKIPSCDESAFASILLFLPRAVYNTGEAVVTSRLVHRIVQTPLGICQMVVDPTQGLDTLGNSAINPLGLVNDTVTSVSKTLGTAVTLPNANLTQSIQLASRNTISTDETSIGWQALKLFNPAVHYQILIDGARLPMDPSEFSLNKMAQSVSFKEGLPNLSGESETVLIQRLLDLERIDPGKYSLFWKNCAGYSRHLAKAVGLGFPSVPNLGIGCQLGQSFDVDPSVIEKSDAFVSTMRRSITEIEMTGTLNDHDKKLLVEQLFNGRFVWVEYYATLIDSVVNSGNKELIEWLYALGPAIYTTEKARERISRAWRDRPLKERMLLFRFSKNLFSRVVTKEFEHEADLWYEAWAKPFSHPYTFYESVSEDNPVKGKTKFEYLRQDDDETRVLMTPWGQSSVRLAMDVKAKRVSAKLHWKSTLHGRCTAGIEDLFRDLNSDEGDHSSYGGTHRARMWVNCEENDFRADTWAEVRVSHGGANTLLVLSPNVGGQDTQPVFLLHFQHHRRPDFSEQDWEKAIWMEHSKVVLGAACSTAETATSHGVSIGSDSVMGGGISVQSGSAR